LKLLRGVGGSSASLFDAVGRVGGEEVLAAEFGVVGIRSILEEVELPDPLFEFRVLVVDVVLTEVHQRRHLRHTVLLLLRQEHLKLLQNSVYLASKLTV
jgi:hypothetical protein